MDTTMKAALCRRYGPPESLVLADVPRPRAGPGAVLVRIAAAGVTAGDARIRGANVPAGMGPLIRLVFGLTGPRRPVLGREFAGTVVEVGPGATGFAPGDAVFGITPGMRMGAHAEFVALPAAGLLRPLPQSLSMAEGAAFFFGGLTAADFLLDQCALRPGERLLVVGATGAVGSAAVQIARHHGARVTGLAGAGNMELARDLGAGPVFDYRKGLPPGPFDVILDVPGALSAAEARARLAPGGRLGLVTASLGRMLGASLRPRGAVRVAPVRETPAALDRLLAIHAAGGYRPLIGAEFPFARIADAHAMAGSGHKRGNVVVGF